MLKTNRTVLGVKLINSYSKEEEKGMKSAKSTRKLNVSSFCEKENVKMLSTFNANADSKLKKKKLISRSILEKKRLSSLAEETTLWTGLTLPARCLRAYLL